MSLSDIPFCDIFYPTKEEFSDFEKYVEYISQKAKSGIVKIIPPKGWIARSDNYKDLDIVVPRPIEQIVSGKDGIYELIYLQRESRTLTKYKKLVEGYDKYLSDNYEENERKFWKTIKFSSPLYGADAPGSIFDKKVKWNLNEIQTLLKDGLQKDIKGVTTPYLYFGSWKAMFAWHKEDLDLCSINYLHFGKPKFWYGIHPSDEQKFNDLVNKTYPEASKECKEFMRHKTYLIHPLIVKSKGLKVHKCLQNPGEFVITLGRAYHAGFNMGFNCAEAVNFANRSWINFGIKAKSCNCQNDSVKVDMNYFMKNLIKRKKLDSNETNNLLFNNIVSKDDLKGKKSKNSQKSDVEIVLNEDEEIGENETFLKKKRNKTKNLEKKIRRTYKKRKVSS